MITQVLRHLFFFGPPRLSAAIAPFARDRHFYELIALAEEYLPGKRSAIANHRDPASEFCRLFSGRYFPIRKPSYWETNDCMRILTRNIPVAFEGLSHYQYEIHHGNQAGMLLAKVLCESPFELNERLVVVDHFRQNLKDAAEPVLELIPQHGYQSRSVEMTAADKWPGLVDYCRWLFHQTGNLWLDTDEGDLMPWSRENVDRLAADYPGFKTIDNRTKAFNVWVSQKFGERALEVARYLARNRVRTLVEVFA